MEQKVYKEVATILMGSRFYFDLSLDERHSLIKHILKTSSLAEVPFDDVDGLKDIAPSG